jgi:hypothetical protein
MLVGVTCIFLSSKLFLFYFSEFPRALFPIIAFKLILKRLFCPWAHWSDQIALNRYRSGPNRTTSAHPLHSLARPHPLARSGGHVALVVASPSWPALASPLCAIGSPPSALQSYPRAPLDCILYGSNLYLVGSRVLVSESCSTPAMFSGAP